MRIFWLFLIPGILGANPGCEKGETPQQTHSRHPLSDSVDAFVEMTMSSIWSMPGAALAIVEGDQVVHLEGYGFADEAAGRPVGPETAFYLASASTPFVAATIAALAERGTLDLDAPITDYLTGVTIPEGASAGPLTLRRLLSHQSGLENWPIVFRTSYSGDYSAEVLRELLPHSVKSDTGFVQSSFDYVLAGLVVEAATGISWKDHLKTQILEPAGLKQTQSRIDEQTRLHLATPYITAGPDYEPIQFAKIDQTLNAAEGIISTAADLGRWVGLQIKAAAARDSSLLAQALRRTHEKHVGAQRDFYGFRATGFGLGWFTGHYRGEELIHTLGTYAGWRAHISFMPAQQIGVVVLSNELPGSIVGPEVMAGFVYDLWTGNEPDTAYTTIIEQARLSGKRMRRQLEQSKVDRIRRAADPLYGQTAFIGKFDNELLGQLQIQQVNDSLVARIGSLESVAIPFDRGDALRIELLPGRPRLAEFFFDAAGGVDSVRFEYATFYPVIESP